MKTLAGYEENELVRRWRYELERDLGVWTNLAPHILAKMNPQLDVAAAGWTAALQRVDELEGELAEREKDHEAECGRLEQKLHDEEKVRLELRQTIRESGARIIELERKLAAALRK